MKDLMFRYSLDAYTIQKGLHIGCVSLRFCYHKYPIKANATDAAMEQLTSCIRNNMYTFASMGELLDGVKWLRNNEGVVCHYCSNL
ncbi:uncharacterized protein LOC135375700 isoform X4 [Ornithodoros turicata]|uniref:uncharacterized protein LOC135375700 isoform X4 n=1 Tax=Ornithodoros turicata TaxID=34597 RepID=UPI003139D940